MMTMSTETLASSTTYEIYHDDQITSDLLVDGAYRFSNHYGIWGPKGPKPGQYLLPPFTPQTLPRQLTPI